MLPELLRFSSKSNLLRLIPEELRITHYSSEYPMEDAETAQNAQYFSATNQSLLPDTSEEFDAFEDDDLAMLGL